MLRATEGFADRHTHDTWQCCAVRQVSVHKRSWHIQRAKARQSVSEGSCCHRLEVPLKMWLKSLFQPEFVYRKNCTCLTSVPVPISGVKVDDWLHLSHQVFHSKQGSRPRAAGMWMYTEALRWVFKFLWYYFFLVYTESLLLLLYTPVYTPAIHFIWTHSIQFTSAAILTCFIRKKCCHCYMERNTICKNPELVIFLLFGGKN